MTGVRGAGALLRSASVRRRVLALAASAAVIAASSGPLPAAYGAPLAAVPAPRNSGFNPAPQASPPGLAFGPLPAYLPFASRYGAFPPDADLMERVVSRTMTMTGTIDAWDWEGGVAMVGLMHAYRVTGDPAILDHVERWMDARLASGTPLTSAAYSDPPCDSGLWPADAVRHPNHLAPAWAALLLYEVRPKAEYLEQVRAAVDFATRRACRSGGALAHLPGQVWDDTLAMAAPLLARSAAVLGRPELLDAAADEVVAHAALLQASDGLWFHGWSAVRGDHMSAGRWARGNGWAALAMSEVVANLPDSHPDRRLLQGLLSEHLMALAASQDPSGLWHTLVDRTDFYLETSGSAAIAAAMLSAPLPDGLETDRIRRAGRRALAAACERVAADGTVTGVSRGTGVAPSQDVYGQVPADAIQPYGQGLWLIMAAAEPRGVPGRDRRQDWR